MREHQIMMDAKSPTFSKGSNRYVGAPGAAPNSEQLLRGGDQAPYERQKVREFRPSTRTNFPDSGEDRFGGPRRYRCAAACNIVEGLCVTVKHVVFGHLTAVNRYSCFVFILLVQQITCIVSSLPEQENGRDVQFMAVDILPKRPLMRVI